MNIKKSCFLGALILALCALRPCWVQAANYVVHFDQDEYIVNGPGDTIQMQVLIDSNPATPQDDPVLEGLFSFGVRTDFNSAKALIASAADIDVEPALNYFGFAAGAFKQVQPGFGGGKGNINQNAPFSPYPGTLLMEVTLTNLASAVDSYPVSLDFFRTVGPNEQLFLNGLGVVLDPQIEFRPSLVRVVPEPGALVLTMLTIACLGLWRLRKAQRS